MTGEEADVTVGPAARVRGWWRREADTYSRGEDLPLGGYVGALGVYGAWVGALFAAGRLTRCRIPDRIGASDIALLTVATHRLARTVAKDPITSPLRVPFAEFHGTSAAAELEEEVRGDGARHAVGELISCPMCLAQWVATAFAAGLVMAPRQTRLVMATVASVAGADFMQYVYALLQQRSGE